MTLSNPLPPFNNQGLLPEGVYDCSEALFKQRFVDAFPASGTRAARYRGFTALRQEAVRQGGQPARQWVNGSYVTTKLDPGDIDVVTFMDYDGFNALSEEHRTAVTGLLAGEEATKPTYGYHTFFVPSCGQGHPFFPAFEQQRVYWRKWFGETRSGGRKGFLAMALGDERRAPVVPAERDGE